MVGFVAAVEWAMLRATVLHYNDTSLLMPTDGSGKLWKQRLHRGNASDG